MDIKVYLIALLMMGFKQVLAEGDLCYPGSDVECDRFGSNMCCAHMKYTY